MDKGRLPYDTLVLVCTNKRGPGERVSCASQGRCGVQLRDKLKDIVAEKGLKGKIRVSAAGCLDLCEEGPNVVISTRTDRIWRKNVSLQDVPILMDEITKGI